MDERSDGLTKLFYTPRELAGILSGVRGLTSIYEDLRMNRIKSRRMGAKFVIPASEVKRLIGMESDDRAAVVA